MSSKSSSSTAARNTLRTRSSTIASTFAFLRESLRTRAQRRKVKQRTNEASSERMRRRSKSVGAANDELEQSEISDVGISVVVASDIGPVTSYERRQSKSIDLTEAVMKSAKRQLLKDVPKGGSDGRLEMASADKNDNNVRRRSKDDHDLPKVTETAHEHTLRKRFGRLFGSLRLKPHTHSHLQPTPNTSPISSPSSS